MCVLVGIDGARFISHVVGSIEETPEMTEAGCHSLLVALLIIARDPRGHGADFLQRLAAVFDTTPGAVYPMATPC